jgi:hypothetical protein
VQDVEMEDAGERYADYNMLGEDGNPGGGSLPCARRERGGLPPVWMIYLPVGDLAESLRRVEEEGGKVIKATRGRMGSTCMRRFRIRWGRALLFAEQNARVPQLERPTEFLASVLRRGAEEGEEVVVIFGAGSEMFPPRTVYGFDVADEYLARGWRYWYVLHNHTRQGNGALGVPVPSASDVQLARNLAAERGLERVRVTNGFYTFEAAVDEMAVFRSR